MRCQREGGLSATTQVKVLSPEIHHIALGQGFHFLQASIAACVKGEYVCDVPGSESVAGKLTVRIGTWENHIVPTCCDLPSQPAATHRGEVLVTAGGAARRDRSFQQAEEARRKYGDMVVGLTHSRGVIGVMPGESQRAGTLEGVSSKTQRDEEAYAIH